MQTWQFWASPDVCLDPRAPLATETALPLSLGHRKPVLAWLVVQPLAAAPAKVDGGTSGEPGPGGSGCVCCNHRGMVIAPGSLTLVLHHLPSAPSAPSCDSYLASLPIFMTFR